MKQGRRRGEAMVKKNGMTCSKWDMSKQVKTIHFISFPLSSVQHIWKSPLRHHIFVFTGKKWRRFDPATNNYYNN